MSKDFRLNDSVTLRHANNSPEYILQEIYNLGEEIYDTLLPLLKSHDMNNCLAAVANFHLFLIERATNGNPVLFKNALEGVVLGMKLNCDHYIKELEKNNLSESEEE